MEIAISPLHHLMMSQLKEASKMMRNRKYVHLMKAPWLKTLKMKMFKMLKIVNARTLTMAMYNQKIEKLKKKSAVIRNKGIRKNRIRLRGLFKSNTEEVLQRKRKSVYEKNKTKLLGQSKKDTGKPVKGKRRKRGRRKRIRQLE